LKAPSHRPVRVQRAGGGGGSAAPASRAGAARVRGGRFGRGPQAVLAAALAALVLYLPGLGGGFVWDDHLLIEQNPLLRSGAGLARALTTDFWAASGGANASGLWRPLITLSYALDGALSRWDPGWFRFMNALAHAAASALVAALALGAGVGPLVAGLAGILFASMPAHAESVAWISGRTDVYCAVFFLLALLLDRRARSRAGVDGRPGRWPGLPPLVALALALVSKETALPFVLVVAAAERVGTARGRPDLRSSALWLAPYAALTAAHLLVHEMWVRAPQLAAAPDLRAGGAGLKAMLLMFPGYVAFAWPWFVHTPAVTLEPARAGGAVVAGAVALHAAFLAVLGWLLWKRKALALPLALFWLTLLPTLVANLARGYLLYSERFLYLPSAGLAWAAGAGVEMPRGRRAARAAGLATLIVLVAGSAVVLVPLLPSWRDDAALFESMARRAPGNYMARTQWARMLALRGRDAEAARELDAAQALDETRPEVASIRAVLAYRRGDWGATLAESERAIARGSALGEPRLLRATALMGLGRLTEARGALEEMRARTPGQPAVESLWGQYLLQTGRPAEAFPVLVAASRMLPADADLAYALGVAALGAGRAAEAREAFRRVVGMNPAHYDAWLVLAEAESGAGERAAAAAALERALRLPAARDGRAEALRARLFGAR